jgi:hypothetical protein
MRTSWSSADSRHAGTRRGTNIEVGMVYSLKIEDLNGRTDTRELPAKTQAKAWGAYNEACPMRGGAVRSVELMDGDKRISRTEWKMHGTSDEYYVRTN